MKKTSTFKKDKKNINNHSCKACMYFTHKKSDYEKHCKTAKHLKNIKNNPGIILDENGNKMITEHSANMYMNTNTCVDTNMNIDMNNQEIYLCENCGKHYKHKQSLYRHKQKCIDLSDDMSYLEILKEKDIIEKKNKELSNSINALLEQTKANTETCNNLAEIVRDNAKTNIVVNNTINNNKFNINVYLNTECNNAMNITEFIERLKLSVDDLIYTRNNGFAKGITNIFVKNLEGLEPTTRPIHCSNSSDLQFYIKDKDKWEPDTNHSTLNTTIDNVSKKQVLQIKEWEKQNPHWTDTDEGTAEYLLTVQSLMDGLNDTERERNKEIIKSNIVEKVELPKDAN